METSAWSGRPGFPRKEYSCGTAPDFNRLRLETLPSGGRVLQRFCVSGVIEAKILTGSAIYNGLLKYRWLRIGFFPTRLTKYTTFL
jgi:hypothetical protein